MKNKTVILAAVLFLLSINLFSQNVDNLIAEGDKLSEELFENEKALDKYLQAEKISPKNPDILWRISRSYCDIAEHMPSSNDAQKDKQLEKYQTAYEYADKAVKLGGDKSVTYLRRAIANGRIALFKGVFSVIGIVNQVKADAEKAIKLGNGGKEVQASAHYLLGRTHAKVCEKAYLVRLPLGLGWGDIEIAEKEYKKAIEIRNDFRMYHLDLGKLYIEEDEYQKARETLSRVEKIQKIDEDDDKYLAEAKSLLVKIKNED